MDLNILFGQTPGRVCTQDVALGYGKVNLSRLGMTLVCFIVEEGFKRTLVSKRFAKVGRTIMVPVSEHPDIDGWLYSESVNVPDGAIVMLQGSTRVNGAAIADAAIFIRIRREGTGLLINANLPAGARASTHCVFSGWGDLLAIDDLEDTHVAVPPRFSNTYLNSEEIEEVFNVREVSKATAPRPVRPVLETVITPNGQEIQLNVAVPARRMRLRRGS